MTSAKKQNLKSFFIDVLRGYGIGIAFIIPGFSGGSVAAILGIYEKLVGAIADIGKDFKKSILTLLPYGIGMVAGILSLLFPLSFALTRYPFPTVSLFVGLAIGGLPSITEKLSDKKSLCHIPAFLIPLIAAVAISFLPVGNDVNLFNLNLGGYVLLVIIGIIGASALVIPGISGSMLLLIFGYYNPIVDLAANHLLKAKDIGISLAVLGCTGLGVVVGFFLISVIMKILLKKHPKGTYFAILGFILGSVPTIFISTAKEAGYTLSTLPSSPIYWIVAALMLVLGLAISLSMVFLARKKAS